MLFVRAIGFALVLTSFGCSSSSSSGGGTAVDGGTDAATSSTSTPSDGGGGTTTAADGAVVTKGDGRVGSPCTQNADCDRGLQLECLSDIPAVPAVGFPGMKFPGGYCTRKCGQPNPDVPGSEDLSPDCGQNGICVQASSGGSSGGSSSLQMCYRSCNGPSDCRTSEGYECVAGLFGVKTCQP